MPRFPRLKGRSTPKPTVTRRNIIVLLIAPALERAARLDRQADHELAHGRHTRAEALAQQAAELRGFA